MFIKTKFKLTATKFIDLPARKYPLTVPLDARHDACKYLSHLQLLKGLLPCLRFQKTRILSITKIDYPKKHILLKKPKNSIGKDCRSLQICQMTNKRIISSVHFYL